MISIIVPVYNTEEYLERCIKSILDQSYTNFEVLLINDGSTDNSLEICKSWQKLDERIVVFSKKNGGVSSARNLGLRNAKGTYITFVDPDDYIYPEYLEVLKTLAEMNEADIVHCGCFWENKKINDHGDFYIIDEKNYFDTTCGWTVWCNLYKKEIIQNNGILFDENISYAEDSLFTLQVFSYAHKVVGTDKKLYFYEQKSGGILHRPFSEKHYSKIYALLKGTYIAKKVGNEFYQNYIAEMYDSIFYFFTCVNKMEIDVSQCWKKNNELIQILKKYKKIYINSCDVSKKKKVKCIFLIYAMPILFVLYRFRCGWKIKRII